MHCGITVWKKDFIFKLCVMNEFFYILELCIMNIFGMKIFIFALCITNEIFFEFFVKKNCLNLKFCVMKEKVFEF